MAEAWHIVSGGQRQITTLAPNGAGFTEVYEISYMIDAGPAAGNTFVAKIPAQLYNTDYVKTVIDAQAALHNSIAGL